MAVIVKAKCLMEHSFKMTANTKHFPKKYRFSIGARIENLAIEIYESLVRANETTERQKTQIAPQIQENVQTLSTRHYRPTSDKPILAKHKRTHSKGQYTPLAERFRIQIKGDTKWQL